MKTIWKARLGVAAMGLLWAALFGVYGVTLTHCVVFVYQGDSSCTRCRCKAFGIAPNYAIDEGAAEALDAALDGLPESKP